MPFAPLTYSDHDVHSWIKENVIPDQNVTIAIVNRVIVGMCAVSEGDKVSWINHLYLKPDYIKRGIGSALLSDAVARLKKPIRLYTFLENELAKGFYEKRGFIAIEFGDGSGNEEGAPDVLYELAEDE